MLSSLADRIGSRPKRVLLATALFVVVAALLGGPVAGQLADTEGFDVEGSGSVVADQRIEDATGLQSSPGVVLLVDTPDGAGNAAESRRLDELAADLGGIDGVATVVAPGDAETRGLISSDGRSALVAATLDSSVATEADQDVVVTAVEERFGDVEGVTIGGDAIADAQVGETVVEDLSRAELIAFPILLVLSLIFFRGRATLLPLLVGIVTVLGTFLALGAVNQVYDVSIFALNLVIGLGLGLAIDYTLFLVSRYREELERSGEGAEALRTTMTTAGRTVVFSALTVAAALITLTVFPLGFLQSMGIAGAIVAIVAATSALLIAPALFAVWGSKLSIRRRSTSSEREGGWYRLSQAVMRRPGTVAIAAGAVMLLLAVPSLRAIWTPVDSSVIPPEKSSRTVAEAVENEFPDQDTTPTTLVFDASDGAGPALEEFGAELAGRPTISTVGPAEQLDESTWRIDVAVEGKPEGDAAQALVRDLRDSPTPHPMIVGGAAAEFLDQQEGIGSRLLLAAVLLGSLTFLVLWLMTGSIVLPVKAILMNLLTVGASLGVLTFIYQDGRLEGLLGYTSNGGVEPTDFLVAAALVFALSTDYGVFLLGRIREARATAGSEREAIAIGLQRTGSVVTAASILLAVAIGVFATSSISFIQQIGVATAAGVLLDAFVVRTFLVPSLMALLGKWNWWSPAPLRRLHARLGLDEDEGSSAAARLRPRPVGGS